MGQLSCQSGLKGMGGRLVAAAKSYFYYTKFEGILPISKSVKETENSGEVIVKKSD